MKCPYSRFGGMITSQDKNGVKLGSMSCNDRAGTNFIDTIGTFICQKLLA